MPAALFAALRRGLRTLFGEIHWQAPPWLTTATRRLRSGGAAAAAHARANPRRSALIALATLTLLIAAWLAWRWYESRPQPQTVDFAVTVPERTCYECLPPGRPKPLLVTFAASVAPLEAVGKNVEARELIRMTPLTAGRWTWDDDRTLRFQPDTDWPIGANHEVTFAHSGLIAPHVLLARHDFEFRSPAFGARVSDTQFYQDPVLARSKKAVVTLSFTHPVDARELEKRIELRMFDRVNDAIEKELGKTAFTVVYDALRLNAHIHSTELQMPNKSGRLQLVIDAGVRAQRGGNVTTEKLRTNVTVPGLYSLRVSQLSAVVARDEREEPDQVLVVAFNHSVKESDLPSRVQAWRLPLHHPDASLQRPYGKAHFPWNAQTLRREVLETSPKVSLEYVPGERDHSETHTFRHREPPGTYLYVRIANGLASFGGYVLADSDEQFVVVPEYPKELRIVQQGSLLSASGDKSVTVMARDVPGIRVEVGRLLPREIHHFVSQTDGSFSRPTFQNWKFDAADVSERFTKFLRVPALAPGKAHYESIPLAQFLADDAQDRRGIFLLRVQPWDPHQGEPKNGGDAGDWNSTLYRDVGDSRLLVITDLGLLAKRSLDGSQDVFVQSLATGEPAGGVRVEILGRNGLEVLSGTTDADGHVRFADLRSFQREQQPVLYLALRGADTSFLPVEMRDRGLDLSRFEIGGVGNRVDQGTLSAYLFSDRGLYRPGEEVRVGALVRSQDWQRALEGVPLRIDVLDPRGIPVRSEAFSLGAAGFGEFRLKTQPAWPAGIYTVSLSIVRRDSSIALLGSVEVQVREFLPDRLRMSTRFSAESAAGWVAPEDLQLRVDLHNLFGTPAQNRRVTARMTLSPAFPSFRAWPDHVFIDPQAAREGFAEELKEQTTDAGGQALFDLNLQRFARATYRVHVMTEGFEADGGRGVTAEAAQLVSSMPYLIGWKGDGSLEYVSRGAERAVELIAVDPRAQRTAVPDLVLVRLEMRYVSALLRQNNGTYQYESRRKDLVLEQTPLSIPESGLRLPLSTSQPGSYAYEVRDGAGQKLARIEYLVAGDANLSRTLEKNAELQIALAGSDYAPGEEIEMQIQAPYVGAGLITIERERVYAWRWFRTSTTASTQRIRLPEGIEGNAYVSVAFVRDPGSQEIYTSPLSYGVAPFSINRDRRRVEVQVQAPALVKPGETLALRYSTARPARIVLFAVDEGILQVARYRTPDPLAHFFEKRALEVGTQQILDLILPEFRRNAAAAGGDAEAALGRHLNPFRRKGDAPVAFWSGILDADTTAREVRYTVPDHFNGTLRVMAVAVTADAVGVHESRSLVRGDFVLSPNAPTTVTPGDRFEVSVGLANNLQGSGANAKIAIALEVDPGLAIEGEARQVLAIAENAESAARFRVRTLEKLGPARLRFTASSGASRATRTIDLSIRPATPFMTTTAAGSLRKQSIDVPIERSMYPEHRTLEAGLSLLPLAVGHGLVVYLDNYPYLCTEQLVSRAVPALMLAERPEFGAVHAKSGATIEDLMAELRQRQNDEGAFKLWPGGNHVAEFPSLYAQHFLLEAQEMRRSVPGDVVQAANGWLRQLAVRDGNNLAEERHSAYAIYLLVRQGLVMSTEAARLHQRLRERYQGKWEQDLTAAWLAGAYRLMRQESDATRTIGDLTFGSGQRTDAYSDSMTRDALQLYVLARHFPERLPALRAQVLDNVVARVNRNLYHSLSAGTTLLALDRYARALPPEAASELRIDEVLRDKRLRRLELPASLLPKADFTGEAADLRFTSGSNLNAYYAVTLAGFDRNAPTQAIRDGFEILREYADGEGKPVERVKLGEQVNVSLRYRALNAQVITDVALVDLLPGGFELVIPPRESPSTLYQARPEEAQAEEAEGESPDQYQAGAPDAPSAPAFEYQYCGFCTAGRRTRLQYADAREDRVVFYATLDGNFQEVTYRIKATNVGQYLVPPAYGEAMYDRSARARSTAGSIEVTRP